MTQYFLPNIPPEWTTVRMGSIARIVYGEALRAENRAGKGGVAVYGSSGIVGEHDKALHTAPSIVIGRKGTVGAIHYVTSPFWCIDTAFYLDDISPTVDVEYLAHVLRFIDLSQLTIVVGVPGISRKDIEVVEIPLPSLPEQRRIVSIMHEADELRRLRGDANELRENLLPSIFNRLIGDPFRNEKRWKTSSVSKICNLVWKFATSARRPKIFRRHSSTFNGVRYNA